jgi:hypothetical protein
MQLIARVAVALLLLNLSLVGQELACAHEALALDRPPASAHTGSPSHHEPAPTEQEPVPCDESASQCCDAIASCTVSGVPARGANGPVRPDLHLALIATTDPHLDSAPLEVATPPPRL